MRENKITTFYNPKQVCVDVARNVSKSPMKPLLLLEYLEEHNLLQFFEMQSQFNPFEKEEFYRAHTKTYVDLFFEGVKPECTLNGLQWSKQFAESVMYTNSSLYHAIKQSIEKPEVITFSPTSGFHHATPIGGRGFCTFSGQVIASLKIYEEKQLSGAYIDLDGHFGNSIEDSRVAYPLLDKAIPIGFNINPKESGIAYMKDLKGNLELLYSAIIEKKIHYVVFAHGADSHEWDDLGTGDLTTEQWIECASLVFNMIKKAEQVLRKPVPLCLTLFGGYRRKDFRSVLSLHTASLCECLSILCHNQVHYLPEVKPRR